MLVHPLAPGATCSGPCLLVLCPGVLGPRSIYIPSVTSHPLARHSKPSPGKSRVSRLSSWVRLTAPLPRGVGRVCDHLMLCDSRVPPRDKFGLSHHTHFPTVGPLDSVLCLCLSRRPKNSSSEPAIQRATPSPSRSSSPLGPIARRRFSSLGLRTPRGSDPFSGRHTLTCGSRRPAGCWRPRALLFPFRSGRVPPPPSRGLGAAPAAPGPLALPLCNCPARRGAAGARRGGAGRGGGEQAGR